MTKNEKWNTTICAKCGRIEAKRSDVDYVWIIDEILCRPCVRELEKIGKAWVNEEKEIVNI